MSDIMNVSVGPLFDKLRSRWVQTPEEIEEYERNVETMVAIRRLVMTIDNRRQELGISKAELARRIGADASVVRRLLSDDSSNPTMKTVIEMLSALGISLELRENTAPPSPSPAKPRRRASQPRRVAA